MEDPATNITAPDCHPQRWGQAPNYRGTVDIIWLCFSTLIICIWKTLHFSIPIARYSPTRRFFFQFIWMAIALGAPELLFYLAINELISAKALVKKVLASHPHLAEPGMFDRMCHVIRGLFVSAQYPYVIEYLIVTEQKRGHRREQTSKPYFGLVHAFYANMGGFAFQDDNNATVDVPKPETFIYIMTHFPNIITNTRRDTILDRPASSGLDKFVLIVQVAWFCISCGSRLFQRLPLTLLEVSTAAHVLCTLATYFVWWSKPLNVPVPTLLRESEAQEVYALLKCSDSEYATALEMAKKGRTRDPGASKGPQPSAKVVLAANALDHILQTKRTVPEQPVPEQPAPEKPVPEQLAPNRPPEPRFRGSRTLFPGNFEKKSSSERSLSLLAAAISSLLYGPFHFLAWNHNLPTSMERLLWRVSSIVVTCSGPVFAFVLAFFIILKEVLRFKPRFIFEVLGIILSFVVIPATHMLASGYLIGESFRQLASLDSTAYQLPSWSYYWPHIS